MTCITVVLEESISNTASIPPSSKTSCAIANDDDLGAAAEEDASMRRVDRGRERGRAGVGATEGTERMRERLGSKSLL